MTGVKETTMNTDECIDIVIKLEKWTVIGKGSIEQNTKNNTDYSVKSTIIATEMR